MRISSRYIIERKASGPEWDRFAFPKNDLEIAIEVLKSCREKYKNDSFRLIEELRMVIDE